MSASGAKDVDGEISKYLNRDVVAVALPGKLRQECSKYPPLILDGASGTGKTQQAFALVKERKTMIYFIMSEPTQGQRIYRSMRSLTAEGQKLHFARSVDEAIKALREDKYYISTGTDVCSVGDLDSAINFSDNVAINYDTISKLWARNADHDRDEKWVNPLVDVVLWMCSKHLQWDEAGGLQVVPIQFEGTTDVRFRNLYKQLKNIILFADEAGLSAGDPGAMDRLRFVRSLGRVLKMRVVFAGTTATAANLMAVMSESKPKNVASRTIPADRAWIECQFLWKTMPENDVKRVVLPNLASPDGSQKALISELAKGRPSLVHLLGRAMNSLTFDGQQISSENLAAVLEKVGRELQSEKRMSYESKLVYLSGVWLDEGNTPPCEFPDKPADLVRGSYFEPCVVLDLEGNPACGLRWGESSRTSGPLRVKIYHNFEINVGRRMWCASMEGANSKPRAGF